MRTVLAALVAVTLTLPAWAAYTTEREARAAKEKKTIGDPSRAGRTFETGRNGSPFRGPAAADSGSGDHRFLAQEHGETTRETQRKMPKRDTRRYEKTDTVTDQTVPSE